ncbi:hypothetical protein RISK_003630 [Rhodopirellula islandica]|uniref:Uncharacterized protein n=1 Tax=Rhodopirellula islandica TaxID=595434 RepID=A0A0J1BDK2_RHOIS|nr:hypothetical protein RISK_003630 [Rhodopirellula islandica]
MKTPRVRSARQTFPAHRSREHRLYRPGKHCGSVKLRREVKLCRQLQNDWGEDRRTLDREMFGVVERIRLRKFSSR